MGWWGHGLLSGDAPMDTLDRVEHKLGGIPLYPLHFDDAEAREVRAALEACGNAMTAWDSNVVDDLAVVAAVYLVTGAAMPDNLRAEAIAQARSEADHTTKDEWGDNCMARKTMLLDLATKIEAHVTGKRIEIAHRGLFEAMEDASLNPNHSGNMNIQGYRRPLRAFLRRLGNGLRSLWPFRSRRG